jgi:phytoene dehydrogenase-like protein
VTARPDRYDAVVVGGGHNGLVAAAYLARAGRSVLVLERGRVLGGAAVSTQAFAGVDARLSRYSYLVSLLPRRIVEDLGLHFAVARRRISSYTPVAGTSRGLLVDAVDRERTRASMRALTGSDADHDGWEALYADTERLARVVWPTLLDPLPAREAVRAAVGDDAAWEAFVERPLGETLAARLPDDDVRGVALTDALIGTFATADDASLRQNRCFLYHVIGGGTGDWDVPIGGMGALTGALADAARRAGAALYPGTEVTAIAVDDGGAEITFRGGDGQDRTVAAATVLGGCAPAVLDRLLEAGGSAVRATRPGDAAPEGAQLKINLLVSRLPRLRDPSVDPREAFAGTFHVGESASALQAAYDEAARGAVPARPPSELYCHSLTDPSILGPALQASGAHTLTLFGLHLPARLFAGDDHAAVKRLAVERTLAELDRHLAEPLADCLMTDADGAPCVEARTPVELERELGLPAGNIFHRDLQWPWADPENGVEPGTWGVETSCRALLVCGAGAVRGGGVSGVPGHNAARALLERG